jgi:hypothetical protein
MSAINPFMTLKEYMFKNRVYAPKKKSNMPSLLYALCVYHCCHENIIINYRNSAMCRKYRIQSKKKKSCKTFYTSLSWNVIKQTSKSVTSLETKRQSCTLSVLFRIRRVTFYNLDTDREYHERDLRDFTQCLHNVPGSWNIANSLKSLLYLPTETPRLKQFYVIRFQIYVLSSQTGKIRIT